MSRRFSWSGILTVAAATALVASCGERDRPRDDEGAGPDTVYLQVVDSIGLEMGDSDYVFGSIDRLCFYTDGSILALDRVGGCVRRYAPDGAFIGRVGRRGSGPGEFQNPSDMVVLGDGRSVVFDIFTGGAHLLDTALVDQGVVIPYYTDPPFFPVPGLDSSFVAGSYTLDMAEDAITMNYFVARFDMSAEPAVDYMRQTIPIDLENVTTDVIESLLYNSCWAVDGSGNVFIAPMSPDEYRITGYRADGTEYMTIEMPAGQVPRTENEIAMEKAFIEARLASMGSNLPLDYTPSPWRFQLRQLDVDGDGNIWALRGTVDTPTFDVFSPDGAYMHTAVVRGAGEDGGFWKFTIDAEGILAWSDNPPDYQKIYILR
jgi:hypothetical protein